MTRFNMIHVLIMIIIVLCCIIEINANSDQNQRGVTIVPDTEKKESSEKTEEANTVNIHTPDDSQVLYHHNDSIHKISSTKYINKPTISRTMML